MTTNPHCPGVPHRPDDPLYRAAVKRHAELGGTVETLEPLFDDKWLPIHRSLCQRLKFNQWGNGLEYRPAEPLRTDGYPNGSPDPGIGWRLLMKGEKVSRVDEMMCDDCWTDASCIAGDRVINGAFRRRITEDHDASR